MYRETTAQRSTLKSVGLDVGTTSTQMVVSELTVENRASAFAVPELTIGERKILYESPVHFTPLLGPCRMDAAALREIVEEEYRRAGITREQVDTGAILITGETSRKENAQAVLEAMSDLAGDFVVAAAGPDLESQLAAKGSGAVDYSEETGKTVLHMDIGGGTSNLALIQDGIVRETGCLNIGGRLVKVDESGIVSYVSPVLREICGLKVGDRAEENQLRQIAQTLAQALEMAAGVREVTPLLTVLTTQEADKPWQPPKEPVIPSFSGGVADCIGRDYPENAFGDMGPALGRAIRESRLCQGEYVLGRETIRATVIGAGCHSAQLSGSTIFYQNLELPLKNLPVVPISDPGTIREKLRQQEGMAVIAMEGRDSPSYEDTVALAEEIIAQTRDNLVICLQRDMAKALGQALAVRLPKDTPILCIDRIQAGEGSYLDIGKSVGGALPVVVKTLVLSKGNSE